MPACNCCGVKTEGNKRWCEEAICQEHKIDFQNKSKRAYNIVKAKERKTANAVKKGKLNGKFCQNENCRKPLKGWFFYRCPECFKYVDDYGMRTNVCL